MIPNTTKPKRKKEFVIIETGQHVWLDRIQNANTYFVCDSPALSLDDNYFPIEKTALREAGKQSKGISTIPKPLTDSELKFKKDKNNFFDEMAEKMPFNCMNCNKPLYAFNKFAKRCVTAHLLPKGLFKTIATNADNIMFLGSDLIGGCGCHDFFDASVEKRTKMKIFPQVLERYELLKPFLNSEEIKSANKYLNII